MELLPALQQHLERAVGVELAEQLVAVGLLVLAQRQADDVDVVLLHRPLQRQAPAAADLEQRHARLEVQLVEVLVDLGDLRLGQRDVRTGEVRAAVLARRVLEHAEEVVGQVVVRLDVLEVRRILGPVLSDIVASPSHAPRRCRATWRTYLHTRRMPSVRDRGSALDVESVLLLQVNW